MTTHTRRQIWVLSEEEWLPYGEPDHLLITAMDIAYFRVLEGYQVCITKEGFRPGEDPHEINHGHVLKCGERYWK